MARAVQRSEGRAAAGRPSRPLPGTRPWYGRGSGWLWVAPLCLFLAVFFFYPLFRVIYLSFFDVSMLNPTTHRFVGFANYRWLATFELPGYDGVFFVNVLLRSFIWIGLSVGVKFVLGLGGALLLN